MPVCNKLKIDVQHVKQTHTAVSHEICVANFHLTREITKKCNYSVRDKLDLTTPRQWKCHGK